MVRAIFAIVVVGHRNPKFYARSFLKVELMETHLFPFNYRDETIGISNFLSRVETQPYLAQTGKANEMTFALEGVGPIRNTSLFRIDYSGPNSNAVQVVASNAANLAISFYATNQPSWQVSLVDTHCFIPTSMLGRLQDSVWVDWHRCMAYFGR